MSPHDQAIEDILAEFRRETKSMFQEGTSEPPPILYHYTNPSGLLGILANSELWASNVRYLNDSSEVTYGRKLIGGIIEKFPSLQRIGWFLGDPEKQFLDLGRLWNFYVTCFCTKGDLLSQWRGYAKMGGGYAIGFERELLSRSSDEGKNFGLLRVIYNDAEQRARVERLAEASDRLLASLPAASQELEAGVYTELIIPFINLMIRFKHPGFEEEAEWRIVRFSLTSQNPVTRFRISGENIVPYISIPFDKGSVKEIYQGPRMHPVLSELAVRDVLSQNGYASDVKVIGSNVPLRA